MNIMGNFKPSVFRFRYERVDKIFDSGAAQGVAMRIKGLIQLPKAGKYAFQAISND